MSGQQGTQFQGWCDRARRSWVATWCALGWGLGLMLQLQQRALWPEWLNALLMAVGGMGLLWCWRMSDDWKRFMALGCMALVAWGSTALRAQHKLDARWPAHLDGQSVEVQLQVRDLPVRTVHGLRVVGEIQSLIADDAGALSERKPMTVLLHASHPSWPHAAPAVLEHAKWLQSMKPGEVWRLQVRLRAPRGWMNPHAWDAEWHHWRQGIDVLASPDWQHLKAIRVTSTADFPVTQLRHRVRTHMQTVLAAQPARSRDLVIALAIGDQSVIDAEDWRLYRETGVAHLVSISGLHITGLALVVALLSQAVWRVLCQLGVDLTRWPMQPIGWWLGLSVALAYSVFAGWGIPAQRTVVMLGVWCALKTSGLRWPWPVQCGLAAWVVLVLEPWAWLQAGFWLSFVAVAVLMRLAQVDGRQPVAQASPTLRAQNAAASEATSLIRRGLLRGIRAVQGLWRVQLLLTLALAPLTWLWFQQISALGLLANFFAVPWVTGVLTPLALLGLIWPQAWVWACELSGPLLLGLQHLHQLDWAVQTFPSATAGGFALAIGAAAIWLSSFDGAQVVQKRALALGLLAVALLWGSERPEMGHFEVLVMDVGQGSASLVRTANHAVLVDAGPNMGGSNAGERVVLPVLRGEGVQLDRVLITHADDDHFGGASAVLAQFEQADLWGSLDPVALAAVGRSNWVPCRQGDAWSWDGVTFSVLHPSGHWHAGISSRNAGSCVLHVRASGDDAAASVLFTGDITREQEEILLLDAEHGSAKLHANVLLAPHHGSGGSSSLAFLNAVAPKWVLVQAGYRNRFAHPAKQARERFQAVSAHIAVSADCGAMRWRSTHPDHVRCHRNAVRRYWHAAP